MINDPTIRAYLEEVIASMEGRLDAFTSINAMRQITMMLGGHQTIVENAPPEKAIAYVLALVLARA